MGFKVKNKATYFGLEFDHDVVPNAIVLPSSRGQKVIKWVQSYTPVTFERADGKKVRRERTAVVCPAGFRLRKDEIHAAMKRNKTENYQDGKFFVILDHRQGQFEHPDTVKMKQEKLRKEVADGKHEETPKAGDGEVVEHPVAIQADAGQDPAVVTSTTESGVEVTDRRRGAGNTDSEKPSV